MVVIGGLLLVAAVLMVPSVFTAWRGWRAATATSAAIARPGDSVVAAGQAVPGLSGPLTAPLSGKACVWYQQETRRHVVRRARGGRERDVRVESVTTSESPFGVVDDDGRVVTVRPDGLRHADLFWVHREELPVEPDEQLGLDVGAAPQFGRRSLHYETTGLETLEWIVASDEPVVVAGRLGPDGHVSAPSRMPYVIRATTVDRVRRSRIRALAFAAGGTLAAALAGVALVAAGS